MQSLRCLYFFDLFLNYYSAPECDSSVDRGNWRTEVVNEMFGLNKLMKKKKKKR